MVYNSDIVESGIASISTTAIMCGTYTQCPYIYIYIHVCIHFPSIYGITHLSKFNDFIVQAFIIINDQDISGKKNLCVR